MCDTPATRHGACMRKGLKIEKLGDIMVAGFYAVYYTGVTGSGIVVLALYNGIIAGADMTGGRYDGTYAESSTPGSYDATIRMSFPPGTSLVTGALAGPQPFFMDVNLTLPANLGGEQPVRIETPTGPVNAIFRKLRDFPEKYL